MVGRYGSFGVERLGEFHYIKHKFRFRVSSSLLTANTPNQFGSLEIWGQSTVPPLRSSLMQTITCRTIIAAYNKAACMGYKDSGTRSTVLRYCTNAEQQPNWQSNATKNSLHHFRKACKVQHVLRSLLSWLMQVKGFLFLVYFTLNSSWTDVKHVSHRLGGLCPTQR